MIFWATNFRNNGGDMSIIPPSNVFAEFQKRHKGTAADLYLRCPSAIDELRRTFVVRAPLDMRIYYENGDMACSDFPEHVSRELIVPLSDDGTVFTIGPAITLFSDEPLEVAQLPAYAHESPFDHVTLTSGNFDVGQWLRPLVCGVINEKKKSINIRRGDPLYYLRISGSQNTKWQRFEFSDKLDRYSEDAIHFKTIMPNRTLDHLYRLFNGSKRRNRVLSEIKNNLVD